MESWEQNDHFPLNYQVAKEPTSVAVHVMYFGFHSELVDEERSPDKFAAGGSTFVLPKELEMPGTPFGCTTSIRCRGNN
jgi:hypothetical protein